MQLRNFVFAGVASLAAAGTLALSAAPSQAVDIASFAATQNNGTLITYNGGTGVLQAPTLGGMTGNGLNATSTQTTGVFFSFSNMIATPTGAAPLQAFNSPGGSFTISTGSGGTGTVLLSGLYSSATALALTGSNSITFSSGPVQYLGGTYLTDAGLPVNAVGSFGFTLSGVTPANSFGTRLNSFDLLGATGKFGATFEGAAPVPEPSEWAVIGLASTTLGGLMVRARRKGGLRANTAAAA